MTHVKVFLIREFALKVNISILIQKTKLIVINNNKLVFNNMRLKHKVNNIYNLRN